MPLPHKIRLDQDRCVMYPLLPKKKKKKKDRWVMYYPHPWLDEDWMVKISL